jgi:hypothetical protein
MRGSFLAAVLILALPATTLAQQEPPELPPTGHNQVLSSNLLGVVAKWFNVEYERQGGPAASFGVSASSFFHGVGEDGSMRRANAFLRFYPQRGALSGIFIGLRGGALWNRPYANENSAVTAGVEIGKTHLLGPKKNIAISTGFGLDRVWFEGGSAVIPNIRLFNLGIAF